MDPALPRARIKASLGKKQQHVRQASYLAQIEQEKKRADELLNVVIPLGAALAAEQDYHRLLERIVTGAMDFTGADGGELYLRKGDGLEFVYLRYRSVQETQGEANGTPISFPPLALYDPETGEPNDLTAVTRVALSGIPINETRAPNSRALPSHATHVQADYEVHSALTVPLKGNLGQVIGVLQLVNAQDDQGHPRAFNLRVQQMVESLSLLASVALEGYGHRQELWQEVQQLRIELDQHRQARQVSEITQTDYFHELEAKADELRRSIAGDGN